MMKRLGLISLLVIAFVNVWGQTNVKDENGNTTPINVSGSNVGIGTTTMTSDSRLTISSQNANSSALVTYGKLQLRGNVLDANDVLATIRGYNYTVNSDAYLLKVGIAGASYWEKFVIKGNGNVGIGTTNPEAKLDVNGVIRTYNRSSNTATWDNLSFWSEGERSCIYSDGDENGMFFKSKVGNKIIFESNVGIGTTNPSEKLEIAGNLKTKRVSLFDWYNTSLGYTNSSIALNGIRQNGEWKLYGDGARSSIGLINMDIFSNIRFISHHDNTLPTGKTMTDEELIKTYTKLIIKENGNVGIGTDDPSAKLNVVGGNVDIGSPTGEYFLRFRRNGDGAGVGQIGLNDTREFQYSHHGGGGFFTFLTNNGSVTEKMRIANNGNVGIGTTTPDHKLDVAGTVRAKEVLVEEFTASNGSFNGTLAANNITVKANGNTADFVFADNYTLKSLTEVENYIKTYKHLPDIPSAEAMEKQGVNLVEMNKLLLQKVEELTLHTIAQEKKLDEKDKEVKELKEAKIKETEDRKKETEELKERLAKLESLLIK